MSDRKTEQVEETEDTREPENCEVCSRLLMPWHLTCPNCNHEKPKRNLT